MGRIKSIKQNTSPVGDESSFVWRKEECVGGITNGNGLGAECEGGKDIGEERKADAFAEGS